VPLIKAEGRAVIIPNMADHAYGLQAAFQACGVPAEVFDPPDDETLMWGRKYTSGKECYPAILTTGDMVKYVMREDFQRDKTAFFMGGSGGPCRFGQYNAMQRMVLDELGYPDVPIYAPNQASSFYNDMGMVGGKFLLWGWRGIVAIDVLFKAACETKPYADDPGHADDVYWECVHDACDAIRKEGDLVAAMKRSRERFDESPCMTRAANR